MRQPILYAEQVWRKQRFFVLLLIVLGTVMSGYLLTRPHVVWDLSTTVWLAYIPSGLLLGGVLLYYRQRNHVRVDDGGVTVSNLLSSRHIGFDEIRAVRVQNLEHHFLEGRKRLIRPMNRELMTRPALFIRLRGEEEDLRRLAKRLGPQMVSEDTIALPVPDPEAVSSEIASRLPERTAANLGGARRRKRAR